MSRFFDNFTLFAYCGMIFWLSERESVPMPPMFPHMDKVVHAGAYFVMGILTWRCFRHYLKTPLKIALCSTIFCIFYGFSDEWHQSFVAGRHADIKDWYADSAGALMSVMVMFYLQNHKRKNQTFRSDE